MRTRSRTWVIGFPLKALRPELRSGNPFPFRIRLNANPGVQVGDSVACCVRFRGRFHLHAVLVLRDLQRDGPQAVGLACADDSIYLTPPDGPVLAELRLSFEAANSPRLLDDDEVDQIDRMLASCRPRFHDEGLWRTKTVEVARIGLGVSAEWQRLEHPHFADLERALRSTVALSDLPSLSTRDTTYADAAELVGPLVGVLIDDRSEVASSGCEMADLGVFVPIASLAQLADWTTSDRHNDVSICAQGGLEHQALLRAILPILFRAGASPWRTCRVDLGADAGSAVFLFEAKCTTAENCTAQVRTGVGQLLEYRYRLRHLGPAADVRLVFVTRGLPPDDFSRPFLASLGLKCVDTSRSADLADLETTLRAATAEPLRLAATH